MESETTAVAQPEAAAQGPLVARRDQLIAAYNEHGTMLVELRQRLVQVEAQRLKLEGAIAMIGEMLGEEPGAAGA